MELATRGSLYGVLHSKAPLSLQLQYRLAWESARGLLHLHECKILHRDIKSANILVTEDWHAKLGDFGLAKVRTETKTTTKTTAATSLRWTAPEMFKLGAKFTEACDVFSFGVVLFEIATREVIVPFVCFSFVSSPISFIHFAASDPLWRNRRHQHS